MNSTTSQFVYDPRVGTNDRRPPQPQPPESYHQQGHSSVKSPFYQGQIPEPNQSYQPPQNMRQPPEQSDPLNRFRTRHRSTSSSNTPVHQHEMAPRHRTSTGLNFEYHRYPSPPPQQPPPQSPQQPPQPPIETGIPPRYYVNPPLPFTYPTPPSAQQPMRVHPPNHQRTASFPPQHPSPTLNRPPHRPVEPSSSAGNPPLATLPSPSSVPHRPPMHHQSPNHQHVDTVPSPAAQMRPVITQLPRDKTEQQGPIRRHTLDSGQLPNHQTGPSTGGRQRIANIPPPSYPIQPHSPHLPPGTQQAPPQPSQTNSTSKSHSNPPPFTTPHPPASAISPMSPSPSPSTFQPPPRRSQSPKSPSQPATTTDETSSIPDNSLNEAVDTALEPLRLGFENVLTQTVQNVRQAMGKMQKDVARTISTERRRNSYLMRCLVNGSEKLKGQEWAVEELKKENNSLKSMAVENGQLKMENTQKLSVMDTLNQENNFLRRENSELRRKNEEVKEALTRAAGFVFQYKEELDKVRADIDSLRKSREASLLSPQTTADSSDLHRERTRLHAERERERIFNDAVKQLRALTALEDSQRSNPQLPDTTRERNSEQAVVVETARRLSVDRDRDRRGHPSSLEASTSKQNLSSSPVVAEVRDTITEHPRPFTPPLPTKVDKEEERRIEADEPDSREIVDVDMDDDDVTVVSPITSKRVTIPPNPAARGPDAEHSENDIRSCEQQMQLTDESRNVIEESESQLDLETQRQRQRQARRGPTSASPISSSPKTRSRKTSSAASRTGMKRNRDEYEDAQEADDDVEIEKPVEEERIRVDPTQIVHSPSPGGREAIHVDEDEEELELDEIIPEEEEQQDVDISINISKGKTRHKGGKVATDGTRVTPPQIEIQTSTTASSKKVPVKDVHPKALGRWKYYTNFGGNGAAPGATPSITQQSTSAPPSPQDQRFPNPRRNQRLGINHMDLLYKTEKELMICRICLSLEQNLELTAAERRKARANTKKFPLNASWTDLINHCQTEHTKACEDMEKLSPSQIAEMKQRM